MSYMQLPEAIKHDRTERRSMSRRVYAEAVGITEGRVHALENKRKLKPGELERLLPFIRDLIDPALAAASTDEGTTPTAPPSPRDEPSPQPSQDHENERRILGYNYLEVMNKLAGRQPPYPWPSQFRLETAPPIDFQAISEWIENVRGWLTEQEGGGTSETGVPSAAAPEGGVGPQQPDTPPAPTAPTWDGAYGDETVDEEDWYQPTPATPPPSTPGAVEAGYTIEGVTLDPALWYVTNGEVATFLDCERRWMLQNYYRLGPPSERLVGVAAVGTRFHAALAVWYRPEPGDPWDQFNSMTDEGLQALQDAEVGEDVIKEYNADTDMVRAMLEGYFDWISETSIDNGLKIVGPEMVLEADPQFPGMPHVRLLAKVDVRVESERDNAKMFLDHKSVGNFTDPLKTLQMNPQMLHYHLVEYLGLVAAGLDRQLRSAGALYNMARRVKRTAQAHPPFYMREPVKHNNEQLQSYWLKLKGVVEKIQAVRDALAAGADHREVAPPRPSDSCSWKCEFFGVCAMMDHSPQGAAAMMQEQFVQINPLKRYEPEAVGETL